MEQEVKKSIEEFFEFEKNDTLEEFQINFNLTFQNFNDKKELYTLLIKLFKIEKQELCKEKDSIPEQYIVAYRINIRRINHILTYLKEQLKLEQEIELSKDKQLPSSKIVKEPIFIKPRKKYRKNKIKLVFSEQTLLLVEKLNNDEIPDNLTKQEIIDLIKYYSNKKEKMIHLKNEFQSLNNSSELEKAYLEIKKINFILEELIVYKKKLMEPEINKKREEHLKKLILPVSFEQIKELDIFFGIDTIDTINMLIKNEDEKIDYSEHLEKLLSIYKKQLIMERNRKNQLLSQRKKLVDKLDDSDKLENPLIEECNNFIKNANVHMNILNNLLNYLKHYKKNNYKPSKNIGKAEFQDEIEITPLQETIEKVISQRKPVDSFEINDVIYSFGHYLKYEEITEQTLLYAKKIMNALIYEKITDETMIDGIYYVWDAIKYRLTNTPKEDENTRKLIKEIRIIFDYIIKNYKEDKTTVTHDYLFNFVDYFLDQEDSFLYLKKIVEKLPNVVNTRHVDKKTNDSEHVVIYIVKKFISNYRKMLKDKKSYYISKDYLKDVYLLFTRCYQLYLTPEEKHQIDILLSEFMKEVNIKITSSRRKYAVKEDLKSMYTDKFYFNQKRDVLKDVDEYRLENQINSFITSIDRELNENRVDLTQECSIKLSGQYNAYSIEKREKETILKIHVIDLYNLFRKHSELDNYLFNQTLTKEPVDSIIMHQLNIIKDGIYPTITYEIAFDEKGNYKRKNGHIDHFKMYKSKIQVKECYSDYHLVYAKGDIVLKEFKDLYRKSLIKNHGNYNNDFMIADIDAYFEQILNQGITEYFKFNHLPFIYSGVENYNEQKFVEILNHTCHILSRLDKDDFNKLYKILNSNVDEFHYSIQPFNGIYDLPIKNPVNYPGIMIQRILHELVFDNRHNEEEYERAVINYKRELEQLVMYLNYYNDYIDKDILKEEKGKIVKVKKMLF